MKQWLSGRVDEKVSLPRLVVSTITGAKPQNEDSVGVRYGEASLRVCIADGHWGADASRRIAAFWTQQKSFPSRQDTSVRLTKELETELYTASGLHNPDPEIDRPAEAAFVAAELRGHVLRFVGYGDCRILLIRNGRIIARNVIRPTWLGAFSHLGLRKRELVSVATEFRELKVASGDTILIFSDGVDECIYETPTLPDSYFIQVTSDRDIESAHDTVMSEVLRFGAEDNASLAVIRI